MQKAQDKVTGHFWEGRFRCQLLLDERAVLAAMGYVDLNPMRARMAETLKANDHTSIQQRVRRDAEIQQQPLKPALGGNGADLLGISESAYIDLVAHSGQQYRPAGAAHPAQEVRQQQVSPLLSVTLAFG